MQQKRSPLQRAHTAGQLVKYVITGLASLTTDLILIIALHEGFGMWPPAASVISFIAAFIVNFTLNRFWSFEGPRGAPALSEQVWRFSAVALANLTFTFFGMTVLLAFGVHYLTSRLLLLTISTLATFTAMRNWVFVDRPGPKPINPTHAAVSAPVGDTRRRQ